MQFYLAVQQDIVLNIWISEKKKPVQLIEHYTEQFFITLSVQKVSVSRNNFASAWFNCKIGNIELQLKCSLFISSENRKINMKIKK